MSNTPEKRIARANYQAGMDRARGIILDYMDGYAEGLGKDAGKHIKTLAAKLRALPMVLPGDMP